MRVSLLLTVAAVFAITSACNAMEQPAPDPVLVLESLGSKSEAVELVIVDVSGRELFRESTGATAALPSLHAASAQVAFWRRGASSSGHELVVWNIATRALRVLATSALPPAVEPRWSVDGSEIVTLHTTTALSYAPGVPFEGRAEVSLASVLTGQYRTLATDRPLIPLFADGKVVTGLSLSGDKKYVVIDARSGQTLHELTLSAALGVLPTANRDVVIAVRETGTDWVVTLHAVNAQTGAELGRLGETYAGPLPSWPGRSEIVFVAADVLKAFDYVANTTRAVGRLEGGTGPLGFDALGTVLLAARQVEPRYGTFSVKDGRLTSAFRVIPLDSSSFGRALGLVRIRR